MSKNKKRFDSNQIPLDFDTPIDKYSRLRDEILNTPQTVSPAESYAELCIELAAVIKSVIRASGKSREEIVDEINKYFGRDTKDKRKCLTITTFNSYLSKPVQYNIPATYIVAIQHICKSLEPTRYFVEIEGGKVISREEVRELSIGKLDKNIKEMQQLKKDLMKGKKR